MSGSVVVDASLVVKLVVTEPYSGEARDLARNWAMEGVQPVAPALIFAEVANAVYKRVLRDGLPLDGALTLMRAMLALGVETSTDEELHTRALRLAHQLGRPTTYDAHYLALAEQQGCELWTADERLWNAAKGVLPWVRWIGEHRPVRPSTAT